jgi:hypothetical protein
MYTHCLFCNRALGTNEVLADLPVGRIVAFDPIKGRVWVVCAKCKRWNLTPIEERWEITEDCERRFSLTPERFSTDNIGLAKLSEGLEIIRIGKSERPEFAAWRYGRRFELRRRNAFVLRAATGAAAVGAAVLTGGVALLSYADIAMFMHLREGSRVIAKLRLDQHEEFIVRKRHLKQTRLLPTTAESGWCLELAHTNGCALLKDQTAAEALWRLMPRVNPNGGPRGTVASAVASIDEAGTASGFLRTLTHRSALEGREAPSLNALPAASRLAVEMAINEETERRMLAGELSVLEAAWRQAEEIAAIADDLLLPDSVTDRLRKTQHPG